MPENKKTKADIIEEIYKNTDLERQTINSVIEAFLNEVKNSLEEGAVIEFRGFGTFEPRLRKGRKVARNPRTGEIVSVEPHYVAAFRAGQELKKNLWNLPVKNEK
ncbi:MAG: integration host factor subunit beta [Treponema sp.]|nr:integration host factor subunit beta [Treponema sp.]